MKMFSFSRFTSFLALRALCIACGNPSSEAIRKAQANGTPIVAAPSAALVKPPFEVKGDAEGLLLVWYDERGDVHLANQRSEIPEDRRSSVRVDALELAPEQRLDRAFVYVADLRAAGAGGLYP